MDCITGLFYAGIITALVILSFVVAKISENLKRHIKYQKEPMSCWKGDTVYEYYIQNRWVSLDLFIALINRVSVLERQLKPSTTVVSPTPLTIIDRVVVLETKNGKKSK